MRAAEWTNFRERFEKICRRPRISERSFFPWGGGGLVAVLFAATTFINNIMNGVRTPFRVVIYRSLADLPTRFCVIACCIHRAYARGFRGRSAAPQGRRGRRSRKSRPAACRTRIADVPVVVVSLMVRARAQHDGISHEFPSSYLSLAARRPQSWRV